MPVLSDMKSLYVGSTPIKTVYAGTDLVWPKVGVVIEAITEGTNYYVIVIDSSMTPFNCDTAGSQYAYACKQWNGKEYVYSKYTAWNGYFELGTYAFVNPEEKKLILRPQTLNSSAYKIRRTYNGTVSEVEIEENTGTSNRVPASLLDDATGCTSRPP